MPFITVKMIEGRTPDQKRKIVEGITSVVAEVCGIEADRIHVFLEDMARDTYARGGVLASDPAWNPDANAGKTMNNKSTGTRV